MKKIKLASLLLTSMICAGCDFYEVEDEASSNITQSEVLSEESGNKDVLTTEASVPEIPDSAQANHDNNCENLTQVIGNFTTKGLDGQTYTQEMFAGKLTLVNIWGTYCSPCISEMPHLARVHKKYEESDFQVVGIVIDVTDSNGNVKSSYKTKADNIVKNAGVTYTSLLPSTGLANFINSTEYIPFSVFIDEHGHQLGESITGSMDYSNWDKTVKNMLYTYMY